MMKKFTQTGRGLYLGPALAMVAALVFLTALPALAQEGMPPAAVVTARVTVGTISEEITLAGTTRPIRDSLIASEVDGRVLERSIENGDFVKKGEPLFILDQVRLKRALTGAQAQLKEVEVRLARALRAEGRATELHSSKVLSSSLYDDAISERRAQEGRKEQVEAQIQSIQDDLKRSVIRAPFAGVVTELHTEVGQWLRQGEPIARLADFSTIEIVVDLPERYYTQVVKGADAPATLASLPDLTLQGKVFAVV
ncbi:MAG: efflux RND transporter periplasmic adaptor subunit, partial [Acidobacteria bacterium]|nr:efflux RND transporter periplasmic adaptor subunit [Acidobacteriota bacterium]